MTDIPKLTKAKFIKQPCESPCTDESKIITVHFNPVSLQYSVSNTLGSQGNSRRGRQQISQSAGKLTMNLIFDTTHTGEDVRIDTKKIEAFMKLEDDAPSVVKFKWGTFIFQGMFEKNTLTFNPGWDSTARKLETFTDVRELQRMLKAQGVQLVTEADETTTGPASFVAIDPDGNPILVDQHV